MSQERPDIVFAGGGTGGHLFPAIAIADELRKIRPDVRITFIGTKKKIESRIVPQSGYAFRTIWISGFRRTWSIENLLFPVKLVVAFVQSYLLLRRIRPMVVVGTGGYVCGPVVFAAAVRGVPTLIQEQNSYPGITTRLLAPRVSEVHLSYESTRRYLAEQENIKVSGNPTRATLGTITGFEGRRFFRLDPQMPVLLVFGGSLGARSINAAVLASLREILAAQIQVIWQTGDADYERIKTKTMVHTAVRVHRFVEKMEYAYAASTIAVCRAGATTLAELTRAGVPSILVPYPLAAADHQTENARMMEEAGASVLLPDDQMGSQLLSSLLPLIRDGERLNAMATAATMLAKPKAASTLARAVLDLCEELTDGR